MREKIKDKNTGNFTIVIMAIMVELYAIFSSLVPESVSYGALLLLVVLALWQFQKKQRLLDFDFLSWGCLSVWIVVIVWVLVSYFAGEGRNFPATAALALIIAVALTAVAGDEWRKTFVNAINVSLLILGIATILLYLFPQMYTSFVKPIFFANSPDAVDYRSGLTSHYSINGICCAAGFVMSFCIACFGRLSNGRKAAMIMVAIAMLFALLLTTKRAPLLAALFSVGLIYLTSKSRSKYLTILAVFAMCIAALLIVFPMVPGLEASVSRFQNIFNGSTSFEETVSGRTYLWQYAYEGWQQSPLFGNGWSSYYYSWSGGQAVSAIAHNELMNLLYEVGILGTLLICFAFIATLVKTLRVMLSLADQDSSSLYIRLSLALQVFALVYGFSGGSVLGLPSISTFYCLAIGLLAASVGTERKIRHHRGDCS